MRFLPAIAVLAIGGCHSPAAETKPGAKPGAKAAHTISDGLRAQYWRIQLELNSINQRAAQIVGKMREECGGEVTRGSDGEPACAGLGK